MERSGAKVWAVMLPLGAMALVGCEENGPPQRMPIAKVSTTEAAPRKRLEASVRSIQIADAAVRPAQFPQSDDDTALASRPSARRKWTELKVEDPQAPEVASPNVLRSSRRTFTAPTMGDSLEREGATRNTLRSNRELWSTPAQEESLEREGAVGAEPQPLQAQTDFQPTRAAGADDEELSRIKLPATSIVKVTPQAAKPGPAAQRAPIQPALDEPSPAAQPAFAEPAPAAQPVIVEPAPELFPAGELPELPQADIPLMPGPIPVPEMLAPNAPGPVPLPQVEDLPIARPAPGPAPQIVAPPLPAPVEQSPIEPSPMPMQPPKLSAEMQAVQEQASLMAERGFHLASRGATQSARAHFIQALRLLADAQDIEEGSSEHSEALTAGLAALREAEDFNRPLAAERTLDIRRVAARHRTPILKDLVGEMPTVVARQRYYTYALEKLTRAAGRSRAAAEALFGLGKVAMAETKTGDAASLSNTAQAMVCYQAAVSADGRHYRAANELGVLLASAGRMEQAKQMLQLSVLCHPTVAAWQNLGAIHKKLGETAFATQAQSQADFLKKSGRDNSSPPIQWVDSNTFAGTTAQSEGWVTPSPGVQQPAATAKSTTTKSTPASKTAEAPSKKWWSWK